MKRPDPFLSVFTLCPDRFEPNGWETWTFLRNSTTCPRNFFSFPARASMGRKRILIPIIPAVLTLTTSRWYVSIASQSCVLHRLEVDVCRLVRKSGFSLTKECLILPAILVTRWASTTRHSSSKKPDVTRKKEGKLRLPFKHVSSLIICLSRTVVSAISHTTCGKKTRLVAVGG